MTSDIWKILVDAIALVRDCPPWLKEQASLSFEAVTQLPIVDTTSNGQPALPMVEEKALTTDYLDFLREQIRLNARGREWLLLLTNRIAALERFVGKELLVATFHSKPHSATLRIRSDTKELIHVEVS